MGCDFYIFVFSLGARPERNKGKWSSMKYSAGDLEMGTDRLLIR